MQWILSFHIIFMVSWFAGLFYLPRLFVYHALSADQISIDRFKTMEKKLFFFIMTPAAILTTVFGIWLLTFNFNFYLHASWMQLKLILVVLLWIYHLTCGKLLNNFKHDRNDFSQTFYRWFNEIPTVLLIGIVILVIVKP